MENLRTEELRIGNLTSAGIVVEIQKDCFYVHDGESSLKNTWFDIKPIQLNEEWHNKFGITRCNKGDFIYKINKRQWIQFTDDYIFLRDLDGSEEPGYRDNLCTLWNKDIKKRDINVHEFQNLHYALSGKELIIK